MSSDSKKIILGVFAHCFEISFWFESNNVASSCVDLHCVLGRGLVGQMERLVANWLSAELPIINRSSKSSSLSDKNHHHWIILIVIIISSKLSVFLWSPYDQNCKINITKTFQYLRIIKWQNKKCTNALLSTENASMTPRRRKLQI